MVRAREVVLPSTCGVRVERRDECSPSSGHFSLISSYYAQERNQVLKLKGCCVRTFSVLPLLLPPPPRCRPRSSVPGKFCFHATRPACTRRAASASARGDRAPHGRHSANSADARRHLTAVPPAWATLGKLRAVPVRDPRAADGKIAVWCVPPLLVLYCTGGAVRGLWGA